MLEIMSACGSSAIAAVADAASAVLQQSLPLLQVQDPPIRTIQDSSQRRESQQSRAQRLCFRLETNHPGVLSILPPES